jgi:hypothetical protein
MDIETLRAEVATNRRYAKRRLAAHAAGLRHLADVLDRHASYLDRVGTAGYPRHTVILGDALQEVMAFLGTIHFGTAIGYAAEADRAAGELAVMSRSEADERDAIDKIQRDHLAGKAGES